MPPQILTTKLRIPQAHRNLTPRPHLIERLMNGLDGKLTLICGPPGYGKTTLLQELAAHSQHQVVWLSLDHGDNVPEVFVSYLIAALRSIDETLGASIRPNLATADSVTESALITLLNKLGNLNYHIVLIMDDYQVIENAAIHEFITFLIEHLPPCLHLVIASRIIPSLPLARLRVRGEINEVHTEDLQFNLDETMDFFQRSDAENLTAASISTLHNSVEGWIDGLQRALQATLAASGHQQSGGQEMLLANDPSIMDYFNEEVLNQEPPAIQEFMFQTSILSHLNASLCEAVTADREAHRHLRHAVKHNLFVLSSRTKPEWFRYHQLFASLLRRRLREAHFGLIPTLHQRASTWYEENGHLSEAIRHSLSGQDWESARRLITTTAETMVLQSRLTTASRWVYEDSTNHDPTSIGYFGASATDGDRRFPNLPSGESRQNDTNTVLSLARFHLALGEMRKAEELLSGIDLTRPALSDEQTRMALVGALGETSMGLGKLHLAAATYRPLLNFAIATLPEADSLRFCWGSARIFYEWNQLDDAAGILQQCVTGDRPQTNAGIEMVRCHLLNAAVALAAGRRDASTAAVEEATWHAGGSDEPFLLNQIHAQQVRTLLMQGNPDAASRWLAECGLKPSDNVPYGRHSEYLTLAWALIVHGRADGALPLLDRLHEDAESNGRGADVIDIGVLKALAFEAIGDPRQAFAEIANALCMAEPERHMRVFLDKGASVTNLLQLAHKRGVTLLFVRELLASLPGPRFAQEKRQRSPAQAMTSDQLIEQLTLREIEVLKLAASGLPNREIAGMLNIALSTTKKHMGNILGKLDAKNRTEAAAKARQLGLI